VNPLLGFFWLAFRRAGYSTAPNFEIIARLAVDLRNSLVIPLANATNRNLFLAKPSARTIRSGRGKRSPRETRYLFQATALAFTPDVFSQLCSYWK
jgi:hypothetical protein